MRIGILQTGKSSGKPRDEHGHHDDFFGGFLKDGGFGLETRAVLDGDFPQDTCHADGRLVTGSGFGVHEEHDWIPGISEAPGGTSRIIFQDSPAMERY